jgi:hypothetical protein
MRSILVRVCWAVFAILLALLIFALTPLRDRFSGRFELFPGIPLILFGISLVILTVRLRTKTVLKVFMIATGASAIGWPSSLFLHSFLYRYYPTEPITYVLFFFVFPFTFAIGVLGSISTGLISVFHHKK